MNGSSTGRKSGPRRGGEKYMFLAARTNPQAKPPHAWTIISMFIVPMEAPRHHDFSRRRRCMTALLRICFYDNVRIPAESLVGEVDGGWKVMDRRSRLRARSGRPGGIVLKVAQRPSTICASTSWRA